MLNIAYREGDRRAVLAWEAQDEDAPWLRMIRRLALDISDETRFEGGYRLTLPWWSFTALRPQLLEIFAGYGLGLGSGVAVEDKARVLLQRSTRFAHSYQLAAQAHTVSAPDLAAKLTSVGFKRQLTPQQVRNVGRIAALSAAATFSVPGAGKTTEALAWYFYRAKSEERLLVIAPKNAFAAWDEQLAACVPDLGCRFTRLRGGHERISSLLSDDPRFMLITYQQLPRVRDLIASHIAERSTHVFLDESHRIKSGVERQTPQAVMSISHLPDGKLILSGTPMPQAVDDLVPQFNFLYPEIPASGEIVADLVRPVYVRTTKAELDLPPVDRQIRVLPLAPVQGQLYALMKSEVAREAAEALSNRSKQAFRRLGRSVIRLLQFVSNPSLLSAEIGFAHAELLRAVLAEGDSPKIRYVLKRARELAYKGHKVLIWSSFVRNVEYLADRLSDLGAVYIHGGVDAGDEDDDESREGKIKLFHDDPNVRVLVANPAAAGEGVSLHRICHYALYLDRTFNAAHYLQSEDRIHRLGLCKDQKTTIELVECIGTVDETVRFRLGQKVNAMRIALNDPSLTIDPIPLDPLGIEDPDEYALSLAEADVEALAHDLMKEGGQ